MKFENTLDIPEDADKVYASLTDIQAVAPCVPGATLESEENGVYGGSLKMKIGPISAQYQGTLQFVEQDAAARRAVISATGTDVHGQGGADATFSFVVEPAGAGSVLRIETDVQIQGKIAQMGSRGIQKVAQRLLAQFGANLSAMIAQQGAGPATTATSPSPLAASQAALSGAAASGTANVTAAPQQAAHPAPTESLDLLDALRPAWLPEPRVLAAVATGALVGYLLGRGRGDRRILIEFVLPKTD